MARKEKAPKAPKVKKPFYRRWWFIALVVFFVLSSCVNSLTDDPASTSAPASATAIPTEDPISELSTDPVATAEPTTAFDPALGKDIASLEVSFSGNINNDVTGNWRLAQIAESVDFAEYALSYYQEFFESDSEVHFIVNRSNGTTTCINAITGYLSVTSYEYVDGEELDAKKIPSGAMLGEWLVDKATGEITDLDLVTNSSGEEVSLKAMKAALLDRIPQEYQASRWFQTDCDTNWNNAGSIYLQFDQGSDDADAALALASEYYGVAKSVLDGFGVPLGSYSMTVVNNGASVGIYSTEDGKTFTVLSGGKRTEVVVP